MHVSAKSAFSVVEVQSSLFVVAHTITCKIHVHVLLFAYKYIRVH